MALFRNFGVNHAYGVTNGVTGLRNRFCGPHAHASAPFLFAIYGMIYRSERVMSEGLLNQRFDRRQDLLQFDGQIDFFHVLFYAGRRKGHFRENPFFLQIGDFPQPAEASAIFG